MKKRFLTIILTAVMIAFILPAAALAAEPNFDGWTELSADGGTLSGGTNYYLNEDVTLTTNLTINSGEVTLDLNGHVLKGAVSGSVITLNGAAEFTLTDSSAGKTGKVTGGNTNMGGGVNVSSGCTFNMTGGTITGNTASDEGGGVYNVGAFNMTGGSIIDNTATNGGGVYLAFNSTCILTGGTISANSATEYGGGLYYQAEACFVAGTPITMADGSRKPIETLEIGDLVRVFDHDAGTISTAKLFDVGKYPEKHSGVVTLHFTSDIDVTVVYGHSFFEREANRYVSVSRDNAKEYIGHEFYNVDDARWETLIGYDLVDGEVDTYVITSEKHLNSVANGMLSNEDGFYTLLTNIFEFGDGLKIDAEKKAKDIADFGLWNFMHARNISRDTYDMLNLQYMNVAFGKGLISPAEFNYLESFWTAAAPEIYCDSEEEEDNQPFVMMLLGAAPTPEDPLNPGLYVGGTLKITGNNSDNSTPDNLYLPAGKEINVGNGSRDIPAPTTGFEVGVTTVVAPEGDTAVPITAECASGCAKYFTSDNPAYAVTYNLNEGYLELNPTFPVEFVMNGHGTQIASQFVAKGAKATRPTNPSEPGWTFKGWFANEELTTTYSFDTIITEGTSIYAKWTEYVAPDPEPYYPEPEIDYSEEYTVHVESDKESVQVSAKIEGGIAAIGEINKAALQGTVTIDLSETKQDVTGVELSKKFVESLADVVNDEKSGFSSVVIEMKETSVELDAKTLSTLQSNMKGNTLTLVVDKTEEKNLNANQRLTLGGYDVTRTFEAYFESNGEKIHDFNGGTVKVSVNFTPEKGKKAGNYKVYYIDTNGKMQKFATKYENGRLTFITGHFSDYAIAYDNVKDILLTQAETTKKGNIRLSWNEIDGAVKYVIYGAQCGESYKKLGKQDGTSFTVKEISGAKPVSGTSYKFYVVAYDAIGNKIKSKSIHYIVGDTAVQYANVETITASQKTIELIVGEKATVDVEYTMFDDKKHVTASHGKALRFTSNCKEVAKVGKDGTITAKSVGTAVIYIQDIGGKWCRVHVTVKEK